MSKDQARLILEPEDGAAPLVQAIDGAKESLDVLIFRFDRRELENALVRAVQRGVHVRALIAHLSSGGGKSLRSLEMRLLKAGVTVSRTSDDLVRYHGKMMIVDQSELYLLGFNFTYIDIDRSRSFGVVLKDKKLVQEAITLFEADSTRKDYTPGDSRLIVSPLNARESLTEFLKGASKELLIYDPNISDASSVRILEERAKAGVSVRAIGCSTRFRVRKLGNQRLHVRLIVRDESSLFLGSQSLRATELDKRREIGVILEEPALAAAIKKVFEEDWAASQPVAGASDVLIPANKIAKKVAKAVSDELPALSPMLEGVVKEVAGSEATLPLNSADLQETVKDAVKEAVKNAVREAVEETQPV
jgi:phosphatidylserine/phosphatidylglycerophosphate/cardiolipin synthase-like enzyme